MRTRRALLELSLAAACLMASGTPQRGRAENIDLSTVPEREMVQLTIYNSEDLTLVRETRKVSFKPGVNPLQFSWAGTLIDPTSVELQFVSHADKLDLLDATFPHDKPQMLYWNVQSDFEGEAAIEITYFTSGISWSADYLAIANPNETELGFEGFVRVSKNSGEAYENAQVRLVVGTINLVEKIAQLAGVPVDRLSEVSEERIELFKRKEMRDLLGRRESGKDADAAPKKPKEIVKEGLSEYFIYTIEGTETIPNGWSKRLRSFEGQTVPFKIEYRYRPNEYGERLVRMYLWTNDAASKLGTTPLPDGTVRVFRDNGRAGLSYLAAQPIKYVPIGDKIEINLGVDPEVIFELVKLRSWRNNIWLQIAGTDKFRHLPDGQVELKEKGPVAGWDDHALFAQRIRNYTTKPIRVEIRRSFGGHAVFRSTLDAKNHDYQTVEFEANLKAGERADLRYELVTHQGRNAKQANLAVENASRLRD
ncbi:MAG TPA: hypothetical protein VN699_21330 [Pirellulales bacterium]|nr:hypothetical protein [Pirellulales bacterium]